MLLTCICTKLPFSKRQRLRKPPGRSVSAVRPGHLLQPQNDLPASLSPLCATSVQPPGFNFRRLTQLRFPPSGPLVREICNQAPNPSLRPTYREVTACGGTFPDTVTYLHGLNTPICPASFRETRSLQAPHLPENGTFIQNRRICKFQAVARSPLPAPAAATSWLS